MLFTGIAVLLPACSSLLASEPTHDSMVHTSNDTIVRDCGCLSQALWYYCQPALASLQLLASLAGEAAAGKLRGSALLNLLHQRSNSMAGDDQARRLMQKLMHAACKPYFR